MGILKAAVVFLAIAAGLTVLPAQARFLQTDPIGSKDDLDLYAYVGGDPVQKTDPSGLMEMPQTMFARLAAAGAETAPAVEMVDAAAAAAAAPVVAAVVVTAGILSIPGDTPNGNGSAPTSSDNASNATPSAPANSAPTGGASSSSPPPGMEPPGGGNGGNQKPTNENKTPKDHLKNPRICALDK
jgi:uncharacterized protein RhaS with RHS repeats